MSTRIEISKLNNDGSVQAIFLKDHTQGWQCDLLYEIKEQRTEPEAIKGMFSQQDEGVLSFASCCEYKEHLLNGEGALVEYVLLYSEQSATWVVISLNNPDWKRMDWRPDTLEKLGVPLSYSQKKEPRSQTYEP